MYATTDLRPLLAERGIVLSREQVYRLVTGIPERLSLATLAALCDILGCQPGDLSSRSHQLPRRPAAGSPAAGPPPAPRSRARRARRDGGRGVACCPAGHELARRRPAAACPGCRRERGRGAGRGGGPVAAAGR